MGTTITAKPFGSTRDGRAVRRFTLENGNGLRAQILDYGCTVQSLFVPDRRGVLRDIALGYEDLSGYEAGSCYFGSLVGRYANRIRDGRFTLNGKTYQLSPNDGPHHLHGIYPRQVFQGGIAGDCLILRRVSPSGEEGFPGTLSLQITCRLTAENELLLDYQAECDAPTVLNLTNHTYFNLNGQDGSDVLNHTLRLNAGFFTQAGGDAVPTGAVVPVAGTALDFREEARIGERLAARWPDLAERRGYDHNVILDGRGFRTAGTAYSPESGIRLTCRTTQPAVQLYTGNFVDEDAAPRGKHGLRYPRYGGLCLETQHFPDSPNHPDFPSVVLLPGQRFHEVTGYRFETDF